MKKFREFSFARLFALTTLLLLVLPALGFVPPPDWEVEINRARVAAQRGDKPLLIYFYNNNVRPCREMERDTLATQEVKDATQNFVRVAVSERENKALARHFQLIKVPTVLFLDSSGREIDRTVGYKTPVEFGQYLERIQSQSTAGGGGSTKITRFADSAVNVLDPSENRQEFTLKYRAPRARAVFLVGDFNDWRTDSMPMQRGRDGIWQRTIYLREGVYEYMFHEDGEYKEDPLNPYKKLNPYEGFNSMLLVGSPKSSPIIEGRTATFFLYRPEATEIKVGGTFNNWEPIVMFRKPEDPAMWGVKYQLPPGQYSYKFLIDDEWTMDPENYTPVMDSEGHKNSSFVIQ